MDGTVSHRCIYRISKRGEYTYLLFNEFIVNNIISEILKTYGDDSSIASRKRPKKLF